MGKFELKGTTSQPVSAALVLGRKGFLEDGLQPRMMNGESHMVYVEFRDRLPLFLEPGPIIIAGTDSLRTAHLTGGTLTADYQRFQASLQPWLAKQKAHGQEYQKATEAQRNDPVFKEQVQAKGQAMFAEYARYSQAFIKANPTSWVSLEMLTQARGVPQYAEAAPLYEAFSPALKNSTPGRQYGEMLQRLKAVAVGAQAPISLSPRQRANQCRWPTTGGKYVLIDFWASWCVPCRAENPVVRQAYAAYKSRNFEVLGISLDTQRTRDKWLQAIAEDQLPWTQVSDLSGFQGAMATQYSVHAIPQNFLIDPSGKIVAANLRGAELQATLARLLK